MKSDRNPNQKAFRIVRKPVVVAKPAEPPPPEIDTAKAVAFAMSIAQEMKQRQRAESEAKEEIAKTADAGRNQRYSAAALKAFEQELLTTREALAASTNTLKNTAGLNETDDDVEPDGGDGTSQTMRLNALSQVEKANKSINEIDEALHRVADGSYGVCISCGRLIAKERLMHSPFVKTCTACQQALESGR